MLSNTELERSPPFSRTLRYRGLRSHKLSTSPLNGLTIFTPNINFWSQVDPCALLIP
ncbi:hypothetical protein J6590_029745 [Homalodisca vitripennis]|nr:hypothetical protein J6590_029745 [Homalodisca vitripennis]